MKKLSGIICNNCKVNIKSTKSMTNEDWEKLESSDFHLCTKCDESVGNDIRLDELEKSREYLNSDYYWKRIKELTRLSDEQIEIMKSNETS